MLLNRGESGGSPLQGPLGSGLEDPAKNPRNSLGPFFGMSPFAAVPPMTPSGAPPPPAVSPGPIHPIGALFPFGPEGMAMVPPFKLVSHAFETMGLSMDPRFQAFSHQVKEKFLATHPTDGEQWWTQYEREAEKILSKLDQEPMGIQRVIGRYVYRNVVVPLGGRLTAQEAQIAAARLQRVLDALANYYDIRTDLPAPPPHQQETPQSPPVPKAVSQRSPARAVGVPSGGAVSESLIPTTPQGRSETPVAPRAAQRAPASSLLPPRLTATLGGGP